MNNIQDNWKIIFIAFFIGITVGVVFYPTKHIEEEITSQYEQEITSLKEQHFKTVVSLKEQINIQNQQNTSKITEQHNTITKLNSEIKTLQSKQKTAYYKIIKPDGTIEIKKFSESEVNESSNVVIQIKEEFKTKIQEIETKWENIHKQRTESLQQDFKNKEQSYQKTIKQLQYSKETTTNPKKFGLEIGILSNKDYYTHIDATLWGPFYMGLHGDINKTNPKVGIGIGIKF